MSLHPERTK